MAKRKMALNRWQKLGDFTSETCAFFGFVRAFKQDKENLKYRQYKEEYWVVFKSKSGYKRGFRVLLKPNNQTFKYKVIKAYNNREKALREDGFYDFMVVRRKCYKSHKPRIMRNFVAS